MVRRPLFQTKFEPKSPSQDDRLTESAIQQAVKLINEEQGITIPVIQFFSFLKNTPEVFYEVISGIRKQNPRLAREIMDGTNTEEVLIFKNKQFFCKDGVYFCKNINTEKTEALTNFSIIIRSGVGFEQECETWFSGFVQISGVDYPLLLNSAHLGRMELILTACRTAAYKILEEDFLSQPIVYLPEHIPALLRLIQIQTHGVQIIRGTTQLGWNAARTCFTTPNWKATPEGIKWITGIPHPKNEFFRTCYNFNKEQNARKMTSGSWQVNSILAALLALIKRTKHGWPFPRVQVQHNDTSERLIRDVFKALGQILPTASNHKKTNKYLSGYPTFSFEDVPTISPVFYLGDTGVVFPEEVDQDQENSDTYLLALSVISTCLPAIIAESPKIMDGPCETFFDLVKEGKQIIVAHFGNVVTGHDRHVALWQYFSEIPARDISSHIILNIGEQKIQFSFLRINISRRRVLDELTIAIPKAEAKSQGCRHISLNAIEGMQLLREFYGSNVQILKQVTPENSGEDGDSGGANFLHKGT